MQSSKTCVKLYEFMEIGDFIEVYLKDYDSFVNVKHSCLHKIKTMPTLVPYTNMVQWAIIHTELKTCIIINMDKYVVGSFKTGPRPYVLGTEGKEKF